MLRALCAVSGFAPEMAAANASIVNGFSRSPSNSWADSSSGSLALIARIVVTGLHRLRNRPTSSLPVVPGICRSARTTSGNGRVVCKCSRAASPDSAVSVAYPPWCNRRASTSRLRSSSSITKTRTGIVTLPLREEDQLLEFCTALDRESDKIVAMVPDDQQKQSTQEAQFAADLATLSARVESLERQLAELRAQPSARFRQSAPPPPNQALTSNAENPSAPNFAKHLPK